MKVLVTGGTGFIGGHVVDFYRARGAEVRVLDSGTKQPAYERADVEIVRDSIANARGVAALVEGVNLVVHCAAQTAVTRSLTDPVRDAEVNILGTLNVLEAVRNLAPSATVIICSTNKVYGQHAKAHTDESCPVDQTAHSPYGVSKLAADLYAQDYARLYGLKVGVFRMSCIYGPRQWGTEDQGWLAWFAFALERGEPITLYGDGRQVRDVLWVDDAIRAFDAFRIAPVRHGVYNLGGGAGAALSLREALVKLAELISRGYVLQFGAPRPADQPCYISDTRRAQRELGWAPTVFPVDGLPRLAAWVQDHAMEAIG